MSLRSIQLASAVKDIAFVRKQMCEISELIKPIIKEINRITTNLDIKKAEINKHYVALKHGFDLDGTAVSDLLEVREAYELELDELQSRKDALDEEYFDAQGKETGLLKEVKTLMRIDEQ